MFVIYGHSTLTKLEGFARSLCPRCQEIKPFERRSVWRYFTLFFIPLFPIARDGESFRCPSCLGEFDEQTLVEYPAKQWANRRAELFEHVKRLMVYVLHSGGGPTDAGIGALSLAYYELSGESLEKWDVERELNLAKLARAGLAPYPRHLRGNWEESDRVASMRAIAEVALADGPLELSRRNLVHEIAAELGFTPNHLRLILADVASPEPPSP